MGYLCAEDRETSLSVKFLSLYRPYIYSLCKEQLLGKSRQSLTVMSDLVYF